MKIKAFNILLIKKENHNPKNLIAYWLTVRVHFMFIFSLTKKSFNEKKKKKKPMNAINKILSRLLINIICKQIGFFEKSWIFVDPELTDDSWRVKMIKINGCTPTCVGLQRIILIYYLHADKSEMTAKIDDKSCYVYSKDMYSENVKISTSFYMSKYFIIIYWTLIIFLC